jgi:hypothetical protein
MKPGKSTTKRPGPSRPRRKLMPISEETRRWFALLESELLSWPQVTAKPMFGLRSFYRGKTIFAALPHSRGFDGTATFILKFDPLPPALLERAGSDERFSPSTRIPGKGWCSFRLDSEADLRGALWWLNHSYESATGGKSR